MRNRWYIISRTEVGEERRRRRWPPPTSWPHRRRRCLEATHRREAVAAFVDPLRVVVFVVLY